MKGARSMDGWLAYLEVKGVAVEGIEARVAAQVAAPLDMAAGKELAAILKAA